MSKNKEYFVIVDKNGKRIPQIWETKLANLYPEVKKRMKDRIKESNKRFEGKRNNNKKA